MPTARWPALPAAAASTPLPARTCNTAAFCPLVESESSSVDQKTAQESRAELRLQLLTSRGAAAAAAPGSASLLAAAAGLLKRKCRHAEPGRLAQMMVGHRCAVRHMRLGRSIARQCYLNGPNAAVGACQQRRLLADCPRRCIRWPALTPLCGRSRSVIRTRRHCANRRQPCFALSRTAETHSCLMLRVSRCIWDVIVAGSYSSKPEAPAGKVELHGLNS